MFDSGSGAGDLGGRSAAATVIARALEQVEGAVTLLNGAATWQLSDAELRQAMLAQRRLLAAVDHAGLRFVGAVDARPGAVPGSAADRAGASLLVGALNASPRSANADVAAARLLHVADESARPLADAAGQDAAGQDAAGQDSAGQPIVGVSAWLGTNVRLVGLRRRNSRRRTRPAR